MVSPSHIKNNNNQEGKQSCLLEVAQKGGFGMEKLSLGVKCCILSSPVAQSGLGMGCPCCPPALLPALQCTQWD